MSPDAKPGTGRDAGLAYTKQLHPDTAATTRSVSGAQMEVAGEEWPEGRLQEEEWPEGVAGR